MNEKEHGSQPYFTENTYKKIKASCDFVIKDVTDRLNDSPPPATSKKKQKGAGQSSIFFPNEGDGETDDDEDSDMYNENEKNAEKDPKEPNTVHISTTNGDASQGNDMLSIQYNELMDFITGADDLNGESMRGHITTYISMLGET